MNSVLRIALLIGLLIFGLSGCSDRAPAGSGAGGEDTAAGLAAASEEAFIRYLLRAVGLSREELDPQATYHLKAYFKDNQQDLRETVERALADLTEINPAGHSPSERPSS